MPRSQNVVDETWEAIKQEHEHDGQNEDNIKMDDEKLELHKQVGLLKQTRGVALNFGQAGGKTGAGGG